MKHPRTAFAAHRPPPRQSRGLALVQVALLSLGLWLLGILFVVDFVERAR